VPWKTDRNRFLDKHPYRGPFSTYADAERWCMMVGEAHDDVFRVVRTDRGWEVEQDVPAVTKNT